MKTSVKLISSVLMVLALDLSVQAGSITNNFDIPVDFLTNGVVGTMWDGVYFGAGDVPGGAAVRTLSGPYFWW
jgi:hypothetical protein